MKFRFNKIYFITFIVLFVIEVLIALFLKDGFIRFTIGDFIVVMLLYCFFKSFIKTRAIYVAIATVVIAYGIEFLQLTNFVRWGILKDYKWISIVLGNHFSIGDLVAYSLGIICVLYIDIYFLKRELKKYDTLY